MDASSALSHSEAVLNLASWSQSVLVANTQLLISADMIENMSLHRKKVVGNGKKQTFNLFSILDFMVEHEWLLEIIIIIIDIKY